MVWGASPGAAGRGCTHLDILHEADSCNVAGGYGSLPELLSALDGHLNVLAYS